MGTTGVAGDSATAPATDQRLVAGLRDSTAGRIVTVKVDQMTVVSSCCPPLSWYAVGIVTGGAGNAAVDHVAGMFVDSGVRKRGAGYHDIGISMAAEAESIPGSIIVAAALALATGGWNLIPGYEDMLEA